MAVWSEEREDRLIEEWRARLCLYEISARGYSNRVTKHMALQEIATALDTTRKYFIFSILPQYNLHEDHVLLLQCWYSLSAVYL